MEQNMIVIERCILNNVPSDVQLINNKLKTVILRFAFVPV